MIFKYQLPDKKAAAIVTLQPIPTELPAEEAIQHQEIRNDIPIVLPKIEVTRDTLKPEVKLDVMDPEGERSFILKMWGLAVKYGYDKQGPVLILPDDATEFIKSAPCPLEQIMVFGSRIQDRSSLNLRFHPKLVIGPDAFNGLFLSGNPDIGVGVVDLAEINFDLVIGMPYMGKLRTFEHSAGEIYLMQATTPMEYYLSRGLDFLKPGGLFISWERVDIQSGQLLFLQTPMTASKETIAHEAEILDAYRMPTFIWSGKEINSEIMVLRKKRR